MIPLDTVIWKEDHSQRSQSIPQLRFSLNLPQFILFLYYFASQVRTHRT